MNSNGTVRRRNNRNRRAVGRYQLSAPNTFGRNLVQPRAQRTLGVAVTQEAARMQMDPIRNGIRVRNREILQTIQRTATAGAIPFGADYITWTFNNATTVPPASPGVGNMGPYLWLGQLATLYDKYVIKKLHFEFIPSLPFTSTGQVGMWWDSDPLPGVPTLYQQLSGNVYAKAVHQSQPMTLAVRPNQVNRLPQYQTSFTAGSAFDTATCGVFNFVNQAGTTGGSTTGAITLGTIWIEYEVELLNPGNPQLGPNTLVSPVTELGTLKQHVEALTRMVDAIRLGTRGRSRSPRSQQQDSGQEPKLILPVGVDAPAFVLPDTEALGPAYKVPPALIKLHTEL